MNAGRRNFGSRTNAWQLSKKGNKGEVHNMVTQEEQKESTHKKKGGSGGLEK